MNPKTKQRLKRIGEQARKKAEQIGSMQHGAEFHGRLLEAVETHEAPPEILSVAVALLAMVGNDFAAGFLAAECNRSAAALMLKKKGNR